MFTVDRERFVLKYGGNEPVRLDTFLAGELSDYSRSFLKRVIAGGAVFVDGKVGKPSRLLQGGEEVVLDLEAPRPLAAEPEELPLSVLYEDEFLLVVDKPAGMVVHPAPGHGSGTLVNALLAHCKDLSGIGGRLRPGIVHRLDVGTSGVMAAAKSDKAHRGLAEQFLERRVEKLYKAVVYGIPPEEEGFVDLPIGRDRRDRKKISARTDKPRDAVSRYRIEEALGQFSFLTVALLTGRTHQVRVHMAHIGCPLVGDGQYGGARWRSVTDKRLRAVARSFVRPALHSARLAFRHPVTGRALVVEAHLPADMEALLAAIRGGEGL